MCVCVCLVFDDMSSKAILLHCIELNKYIIYIKGIVHPKI